MRVALIADIHGNLAALEAVLTAIAGERPDQIVCLGDVAATGPQPVETLRRLRELGCPVVMGNTDADLIEPRDAPPFAAEPAADDARRIAEIDRGCAAQLDETDRAYLASFGPTVGVELGPDLRLPCSHGSPRSFDNIVAATTPDDELDAMLAGHDAALFAGGHRHVRMLRDHRGRTVINPGSVGLAYEIRPDGSVRVPPWAECAVVAADAVDNVGIAFRRLPYDREATIRAMVERGMPHAGWWAGDWR